MPPPAVHAMPPPQAPADTPAACRVGTPLPVVGFPGVFAYRLAGQGGGGGGGEDGERAPASGYYHAIPIHAPADGGVERLQLVFMGAHRTPQEASMAHQAAMGKVMAAMAQS